MKLISATGSQFKLKVKKTDRVARFPLSFSMAIAQHVAHAKLSASGSVSNLLDYPRPLIFNCCSEHYVAPVSRLALSHFIFCSLGLGLELLTLTLSKPQ